MKVYLAKDLTDLPMYGDVPDLTQALPPKVVSFEISEDAGRKLDSSFVDSTNTLCDATLDFGDYQYYDPKQCGLLLKWVENTVDNATDPLLLEFYHNLRVFLEYAVSNNTGLAIEL
ncbi:MAG: hypothetical protein J6Y08_02245 [Clostridiales bacterium]|nr:hypothetical protein [Clostridiales bacterium]